MLCFVSRNRHKTKESLTMTLLFATCYAKCMTGVDGFVIDGDSTAGPGIDTLTACASEKVFRLFPKYVCVPTITSTMSVPME